VAQQSGVLKIKPDYQGDFDNLKRHAGTNTTFNLMESQLRRLRVNSNLLSLFMEPQGFAVLEDDNLGKWLITLPDEVEIVNEDGETTEKTPPQLQSSSVLLSGKVVLDYEELVNAYWVLRAAVTDRKAMDWEVDDPEVELEQDGLDPGCAAGLVRACLLVKKHRDKPEDLIFILAKAEVEYKQPPPVDKGIDRGVESKPTREGGVHTMRVAKKGKGPGRAAEALEAINAAFASRDTFKPTGLVKEKLGVSSSNASVLVSGLVEKGEIVRTGTHGEYRWPEGRRGATAPATKVMEPEVALGAKAKSKPPRAKPAVIKLPDDVKQVVLAVLMDGSDIRSAEEREAIIAAINKANEKINAQLQILIADL